MIISVFTPHGGCPERCTFCDQRVSGGTAVSKKDIDQRIQDHLAPDKKNTPIEVAFYGGTFTALSHTLQIAYLDAVKPYLESGQVHSIRISTRPDHIDFEWIKFIKLKYNVKTIELGVQSFEPEVLKSLGRSHSVESVYKAMNILQSLNIDTSVHLMIGSPNESISADQISISHILKIYPKYFRLHPLLVIKGTELERQYERGEYHPLDLETAVDRCANITKILEKNGVLVIRLGLQPNEVLSQSVVAGPYHPAFGELVRSRIQRQDIEEKILSVKVSTIGRNLELECTSQLRSQIVGQHYCNLSWIKKRFNLGEIRVTVVAKPSNEFKVRIS